MNRILGVSNVFHLFLSFTLRHSFLCDSVSQVSQSDYVCFSFLSRRGFLLPFQFLFHRKCCRRNWVNFLLFFLFMCVQGNIVWQKPIFRFSRWRKRNHFVYVLFVYYFLPKWKQEKQQQKSFIRLSWKWINVFENGVWIKLENITVTKGLCCALEWFFAIYSKVFRSLFFFYDYTRFEHVIRAINFQYSIIRQPFRINRFLKDWRLTSLAGDFILFFLPFLTTLK